MKIRRAECVDAPELASLCALLWPNGSIDEHRREVSAKICEGNTSSLPLAIFVSEDKTGALSGFIEVGLRSHADGCDTTLPVGFIEGWFVRESSRGRGVGRQLVRTAENWAREQGCIEIASDALIDNELSQHAHTSLGFEVVDRCVHFKKKIEARSSEEI